MNSPGGAGDVIGLDALAEIDPSPGDAVLFHTGWGARWDDPDDYVEGARARDGGRRVAL